VRKSPSATNQEYDADTPADDPAQYERFRQFVAEHNTDNDSERFDREFKKMVPPKKP
jgi:hypothetical protein